MPSDVVARICDEVRAELERKDLKTYVNSILTAHVVKRPPDHEAGLALLLRLKGLLVAVCMEYYICSCALQSLTRSSWKTP